MEYNQILKDKQALLDWYRNENKKLKSKCFLYELLAIIFTIVALAFTIGKV